MKRHEVLDALDRIYEMSDEEIKANPDYIRKVSNAAYSLIKQKYEPQKTHYATLKEV